MPTSDNMRVTAINIMATFIHNEPTCLPVIQEAGLPEAFYGVVEDSLEPVIEVCTIDHRNATFA